jgi:hypothetical protein
MLHSEGVFAFCACIFLFYCPFFVVLVVMVTVVVVAFVLSVDGMNGIM